MGKPKVVHLITLTGGGGRVDERIKTGRARVLLEKGGRVRKKKRETSKYPEVQREKKARSGRNMGNGPENKMNMGDTAKKLLFRYGRGGCISSYVADRTYKEKTAFRLYIRQRGPKPLVLPWEGKRCKRGGGRLQR